MWHVSSELPVAVWQLCELLYTCFLLTYLHYHHVAIAGRLQTTAQHTDLLISASLTHVLILRDTVVAFIFFLLLSALGVFFGLHGPIIIFVHNNNYYAGRRAVLTNGHTGHVPRAPEFFFLFERPPTGCGEIHF